MAGRDRDDVTRGIGGTTPPRPAPAAKTQPSGNTKPTKRSTKRPVSRKPSSQISRRKTDATLRVPSEKDLAETSDPGPTKLQTAAKRKGSKRRRTSPGGTLFANLNGKALPVPVQLKHVSGEHEIGADERTVEGRYVIGQELGRGGMGIVQLVKDLDIGRHVAMKTLNPNDPDAESLVQPLISEAQTTGQLQHPNIIPVYELGATSAGEVFYTMKAVSGMTLKDVLRRLRQSDVAEYTERRMLNIFGQICLALHYAHNSGVVHRDLKPDNVLLGAYGEVLVMDWGIAYVMGRESFLSQPGLVVGTPHYMAPEQARGEIHLVDARTDIFALGVILYEILTLETPITTTDTDQALDQVRALVTPKRPEKSAVTDRPAPPVLADICVTAMSPDPEERYPNARMLYDMIEAYLEGSAENERRNRMAMQELAIGIQALDQYMELRRQRDKLERRIQREERKVHRWDSAVDKRKLWELKGGYSHMELRVTQAFTTAVNHFSRTIGLVPEQPQARAALANLNWARFEEAEKRGDISNMMYFADRVMKFNDEHGSGPLQSGTAFINVRSFPEGAMLTIFDFSGGVPDTALESGTSLGPAPAVHVDLNMGLYLLVARKEGYRDARMTIFVRPGEPANYLLTLVPWMAHEAVIGRAGELDLMKLNFQRAVAGRLVRRVLVAGPDGIGKNRLLAAFTDYIEALPPPDVHFFFAECHEHHTLIPYGAVTEALRIRAGVLPNDTQKDVRAKMSQVIDSAVKMGGPPTQKDRELIDETVAVLAKLPGMAAGDMLPDLPPEQMRRRFDVAFLDFLRLITRWGPALFYFQEVEYLDDASARLLRGCADELESCPLIIIGIGSDVSPHGWDERIRLESLRESAVDALLRDLLKAELPAALHEYVMRRSRGVPWLVVDTVCRLAESYGLYSDEGIWYLKDGLPDPEVASMFEARREMVEDLPERLARALQLAAVIGDVFWMEALDALGIEDAEECCAELTEREFIRTTTNSRYPGTRAYSFRSLLFREIVYDNIYDPDILAARHKEVADWMRDRFQGDIREVAELARHVELARDEDWAALLYGQLGDACRDAGCFGLARECYQRALTNTVMEEDRVALEERLSSVKAVTGRT